MSAMLKAKEWKGRGGGRKRGGGGRKRGGGGRKREGGGRKREGGNTKYYSSAVLKEHTTG